MQFPYKKPLLTISILVAMQAAWANEDTSEVLPTITVNAEEKKEEISTISKSAEQLSKEMVSDSRDLVRYETGVTVVESGRFGASGYAIRGVDENRVAITVDGLHQAETLASQGFKELFEGYGNFNNTRNSVEIEHLKQATIRKGADSTKVGSGALGGAVVFETKDARDYLTDKDYHISHKIGYSTDNNQLVNSLTLAGKYKNFDALIIGTKRDGHQMENYGYKLYDDKVQGRTREKADPYDIQRDSVLAKLSFNLSENHRFTVTGDISEQKSQGRDWSYTLNAINSIDRPETATRHTDDKSERQYFALSYENSSPNLFWDNAKFSVANQKITTQARTDDYCDGGLNCDWANNPAGLQYKDGKTLDKHGGEVTILGSTLTDSKGQVYDTGYKVASLADIAFNCDKVDCNSPVSVVNSVTGNTESRTLTTKTKDGVTYGTVEWLGRSVEPYSSYGSGGYRQKGVIVPSALGYNENLWVERDLNTDTKQFNMDLEKSFSLGSTEHKLEYGGLYSQTDKSMVNRTGYFSKDIQWWNQVYWGKDNKGTFDSCRAINGSTSFNNMCGKDEPEYSFLIPVETKDSSLYFAHNMQLNSWLGFDLGYRYSNIRYKPKYEAGKTPKIPDDMVQGLFLPLEINQVCTATGWCYTPQPSDAQKAQNVQQNIDYLAKPKKYSQHSYSLVATVDPTDNFKVQMKYSKGFRIPTADELYFTFKHPDFTVLPNVNLAPETAKTQELALTWYGQHGFITGSLFKTDYDDFIDFIFKGNKSLSNIYGGSATAREYPLYHSVNQQSAEVKGFEINSRLDIGSLWSAVDGLNATFKFTEQRGKINNVQPMNAIQPRTAVLGLGYDHPNERFGLNLYMTHAAQKKAMDSYNMFWKEENATNSHVKWRSKHYTLLDLTAYVKPTENLTLQAGVYNLTNRKYMTWDAARSIRSFGTSNMVGRDGQGINRFLAPERNFKLSMEFKF